MQFQSIIKIATNALIWPFYDHFTQLYNGDFLPAMQMYKNQVCPILSEAFLTGNFRLEYIYPEATIVSFFQALSFRAKGRIT